MNISENYYSILEVDRNATESEIKKSYRKLAMKYHPDKCSGEEEKFKKIAEAYSILSDKTKKAQYDICGFAEINIGDPMEIFTEIFTDFKPDIFANISDNIIGKFSNNKNVDTNIFVETFIKTDIIDNNEKKISEIIKVPIYYNKEIRFKGMGHNKKNHSENGDVIFKFDCIEDELFKIHHYHLIYNKDINVSNLYGEFKFDLELPDTTIIKIECNDLYKTDLIIVKENLGLPIPNENKRSNLFIKFNVIYPELNDDEIETLKNIFCKLD
jgi:curved DNA-binding protein